MNVTEPFRSGDIRAEHIKYSFGGDPIVVIEADTAMGSDAEVVLNMAEAKALHEWLGRVVAGDGQ